MSSRATRDITYASPSKASSSPAMPPIRVERETRRTRRVSTSTSSVPKISGPTRQPSEVIPKKCSPAAISHLPSWGCTMNDEALFITSGLPARILALASSGQERS